MWNFFKQPWTLLGAAVLVLLGVLTFRSVWDEKRRPWQWLLPAGVAVLALGLEFGVTTDLEKIHRVIRTGLGAVEAEDCATIARLIADDYQDSYHQTRESLLTRCRARLQPPAVQRVRRVGADIEIASPDATVALTVLMTFDRDSIWAQAYKQNVLIGVRISLHRQRDTTWRIQRIEIREVDKTPASWGMT